MADNVHVSREATGPVGEPSGVERPHQFGMTAAMAGAAPPPDAAGARAGLPVTSAGHRARRLKMRTVIALGLMLRQTRGEDK